MTGEQSEQELAATFYVYRIYDGAQTLYVGKGSGRRLKQQMRAFRCDGAVLEWFKDETKAFEAERRWIAFLKPTENKCQGGNGGWKRKKHRRRAKWEKEMDKVGTRVYCARLLLSKDLRRFNISPERMTKLREVANGAAL